MDNKLEYIISIIDKATAPMAKFGQSAIAHFTKIEDAQKKFARTNELAGKSFNSLGKQIDALKAKAHGIEIVSNSDIAKVRAMNSAVKDLERQQSKIGNMNGSKLKGWATDAASQIPGAGLISNPLVMGGAALAGVVKAGMNQENSRMAIQGLSGSEEKGNKFFGQAQDYAVSTSYSQKGVLDAGQGMLANGMGGDAAMNTIKMLGDVAMGSDEKLASLANMMSRVNITGYLQGDELNSLVEAGFNPLKEISDATGESYASLKKKMEDGGISMGMVQGALARLTGEGGRMHGMAEKMSKTFGGQLNTMMEQFMKTAATIGEAILPILNVALGVLNTALEFIVENGDVLAVIIGAVGLSMLLAGGSATGYAIGMELASIATNIASSAVYKFGVALLTTPIGWICLAIGVLVIAVRKIIDHFGSVEQATQQMKIIFMNVWEIIKTGFGMYVNDIVATVQYMFYKIIGFFDRMIQSAKSTGKAIGMAMDGDFSGAGAEWNKESTSEYDTKADGIFKQNLLNQLQGRSKIAQLANANGKAWNTVLVVKDGKKAEAAAGDLLGSLVNSNDDGKDKGSTKGVTDGITGGGTRNVYINLGKFQDSINIHVGTAKEGVSQMSDAIQDELLRLLNSAGAINH